MTATSVMPTADTVAVCRSHTPQGEVVSVDQSSQEVVLASGTRLHYDYLVLATGASPFLLVRARAGLCVHPHKGVWL